jgi:hypothetical protein
VADTEFALAGAAAVAARATLAARHVTRAISVQRRTTVRSTRVASRPAERARGVPHPLDLGAAVRGQRPRWPRPPHASAPPRAPVPGPRMCRTSPSLRALDVVGDARARPRGACARHERAARAPLHAVLARIGGGRPATCHPATADQRIGRELQAASRAAPGSRYRSRPCSPMARAPRRWELELGPALPPAMPTALPLGPDPVPGRFRATGRGLARNPARLRSPHRTPDRRR